MSKLEVGQRVMLLHIFGAPVGESTVERLTPKRAILANGLIVTLDKFQIYGDKCRIDGEKIGKIAVPSLELEQKLEKFKANKQQANKLKSAKSQLYCHIEHMQYGYFRKCTDQQIFDALDALNNIFGEQE